MSSQQNIDYQRFFPIYLKIERDIWNILAFLFLIFCEFFKFKFAFVSGKIKFYINRKKFEFSKYRLLKNLMFIWVK